MKKYLFTILLSLIFTASCLVYIPYPEEEVPPTEEEYYEEPYEEPSPGLDIAYFYDYLSPYGTWVYYPPYEYVWVPYSTRYRWRPYTYGRWLWTDYGWTWVSNFKWGWAPFHYGRWAWARDLGWFWVPDTTWGPGWVTWRRSNLYLGWAPLPPEAHFVVGVGIRRLPYSIPASHWVFVDGIYFLDTSLHNYIFPVERNVTIINYTVHRTNILVRNRRVINAGVELDHVQKLTRKRISKYELKEIKKAGASRVELGNVQVYRPKIRKSQAAKPKTVLNKQEAQEKISKARILKPEKGVLPSVREKRIKEVHEREVGLLEKSQQKEVMELKRKLEKEKESARTQPEKTKVEREYGEKILKLKKSHEAEKSRIKTRHKEEEEKAKKEEEEEEKAKKKKVKKKIKK